MCVAIAGPPPPAPIADPPGAFSFGVLGDAPYYLHEELQYRVVMQDLEQHELASVIHIGDIFWRPCSDAMYVGSRRRFDALRHPVVYTPGDNEWFDCWDPRVGGYVPLERLARLRQVFFDKPTRSLGRRKIALESQPALSENARWRQGSVVFATAHVIGSANGMKPFRGRTAANDAEVGERSRLSAAWLRETFAEARVVDATAVVIAFHANVFRDDMAADLRQPYEPFLTVFAEEAARFGKVVLAVHGDDHKYIVDSPVREAPNVTRLQVPGSPNVGWVRVTATPGAAQPFSFERRVVPGWKYW